MELLATAESDFSPYPDGRGEEDEEDEVDPSEAPSVVNPELEGSIRVEVEKGLLGEPYCDWLAKSHKVLRRQLRAYEAVFVDQLFVGG